VRGSDTDAAARSQLENLPERPGRLAREATQATAPRNHAASALVV
jgi:hypothetical protein